MSKRKRASQTDGSIFDSLQDTPSLADTTDEIFGVTPFPDTPTIRVKFLDIDRIYPDPEQPRRAIPSQLREVWNSQSEILQDLFDEWIKHFDTPFDLESYLVVDGMTSRTDIPDVAEDADDPYKPTPIQESFLRLLDLASSILREGLTNPITVSRSGGDYLIETGERRWLAFHLLRKHFKDSSDEDWSKIPARIMPERNIWRQATENNARQNLNAVSRARQLALLLMDIYGRDNFEPMSTFDYEQEFYAQVSDGNKFPFPGDKKELLLKAMGLNSPTQLRQYRKVLRADGGLWQKADDENWTENAIREEMFKIDTGKVPPRYGKPKKVKRVTIVTPEQKASMYDQARQQARTNRSNIEQYAKKAQGTERTMWQEFIRREAEYWNKLADDLD